MRSRLLAYFLGAVGCTLQTEHRGGGDVLTPCYATRKLSTSKTDLDVWCSTFARAENSTGGQDTRNRPSVQATTTHATQVHTSRNAAEAAATCSCPGGNRGASWRGLCC